VFRLRLECLEDRVAPATYVVNTTVDELTPGDGKTSLREAIALANSHPGPDTIMLPAGVYKIQNLGPVNNFNVTDSVTIIGDGAGSTVVDGQQLDRVFSIFGVAPGKINVTLQGMTIRNGLSASDGGGILMGVCNLTLNSCVVSGNAGQNGAGIACVGDANTLTVMNSSVSQNVASQFGGGISLGGTSMVKLSGSTVRHNIALGGGGISAGDTTTVTLSNSTVSGNLAEGGTSPAPNAGNGGGILANTVILTGSTISGNFAKTSLDMTPNSGDGGGIFANTVTLTNSTVSGNFAYAESSNFLDDSFGGGIFANNTVRLTNSTVSGNSAVGFAGGIFTSTTVTLTNSTVSGNTAPFGGGGISGNTVTMTNSTVSGNAGGGIRGNTVTVTGSTVSDNKSTSVGGGIYAGTLTATNSTISGNSAGGGGGIASHGGNLLNDTIADNIASGDGAGVFSFFHGIQPFNVKNTIIALNVSGFDPDIEGPFSSLGHNLIGNGTGNGTGFTNGTNGDQVGTAVNPIDPMLGPLQFNGGPTMTMALLPGSPAIDKAANHPLVTLSAAITATATSFVVSAPAPFAPRPDTYLRLGSEIVFVVSFDSKTNTLTVRRGMLGTMAAAHAKGVGLLLATDQRGLIRPLDAFVDIGAFELS
jgi:CSLREA domain-containing protein